LSTLSPAFALYPDFGMNRLIWLLNRRSAAHAYRAVHERLLKIHALIETIRNAETELELILAESAAEMR
jgi:hypothetical protein